MTIVKDTDCNVDGITTTINQYVPQAKVDSNVGAELSYVLPKESSDRFEELLTDIETNQKSLGIASFGISETTMEEVFLR